MLPVDPYNIVPYSIVILIFCQEHRATLHRRFPPLSRRFFNVQQVHRKDLNRSLIDNKLTDFAHNRQDSDVGNVTNKT